jgi:hypothetical protein
VRIVEGHLTILLALMVLRSSGRRVRDGGGGRRRVGLVVDHFLHLLLLVASPMGIDGGRGFLFVLVAGLPRVGSPRACGLVTGHDLPLGMISRHHFEWLDSNEVPEREIGSNLFLNDFGG